MPRFPGVIPAVTTPFTATGEVDHAALADSVEWLLDAGVHGFVAAGTMGEAGSLTGDERGAVVRTVVGAAAGRVPVLAGISSGTAAQSAAYARDAQAAGVDGLMCLPPLGYRGDAAEITAYFADVAAATELPIMLYNNPEASGVDLPPQLIADVAGAVERVVAVKECSGDVRRIPHLIELTGGELEILVGGDDWPLEGLAAGATGWISGVAVVAPRECVELSELCRPGGTGDFEAARALYARLLPLARFDMTPKLVQYFKAAQDAIGRPGGPTRAARRPLTAEERAALDAALAVLGAPAAVA